MFPWRIVLNNNQIIHGKKGLLGNWPGWCLVLAVSLNVTVVASPDCGYLTRVGPAPLRFAPVIKPSTNQPVVRVVTAPVKASPPSVAPTNMATAATSVLPPAQPGSTQSVPTASNALSTNAVAQQPLIQPGPADGAAVSPQMLLRYFSPSTNGQPGVVAPVSAPMDFTPPRAPGPAPSTASYSTSP